uniref:C2H2-type domain-containing protein n=1 Tax=Oryzias latipes TaxID=8090 RepID=A0A3B3HXK8_ORYLA
MSQSLCGNILVEFCEGLDNGSSGQPEPEPLYHCGECGKTFTHLSSLRRHLRSHGLTPESQSRKLDCNSPSPERIFCCGECGKRFKKRETLRRHNRVHTGEKPHACEVCGKMFREPFHLTKHLTVHSGQKNYKIIMHNISFNLFTKWILNKKVH